MIILQSYTYKSGENFLRKCLAALAAALILCNYYYLYFFEFDQGVSSASGYFSALKFLGVAFFTLAFFEFKANGKLFGNEVILISFVFFSFVMLVVKKFYIESGSDLYLNVLLSVMPFVFLSLRRDVSVLLFFFEFCVWLLMFQVAVDSYVKYKGYSLWDNKAFIGGLGNPSSFGLLCNIVLSYVLFVRKRSVASFLIVLVIFYAVISSKSLFSLLAMTVVVFYFLWSKNKFGSIVLSILLSTTLVLWGDLMISGHLAYKLSSLYASFFNGGGEGSQSIMLRIEIHELFFERVSENFFSVVFFGYDDFYYYNADSQFLSFFGSFGVVLSLLFFASIFYCLVFFSRKDGLSKVFWISIFLYFLMFFSNRVVDYYPMPLLFFMLVFGSRRLTEKFQ